MSEDNTFIIVTKPETGFLWDQLSQRERLESLKNIMMKKLGNEMEEPSIDILVNTINNMYLDEYKERNDPINFKYSDTKTNPHMLLAKFRKILQETNWIIPIVFDRRKITPDTMTDLDSDSVYVVDPYYVDRKIKEYYNNINTRLLQKLQNPYIAAKSVDTKKFESKLGPFTFNTSRKAVWFVNIPKSGKVEYSQLKEPRVILEHDKIYLNGVILDPTLKDHFNFIQWYFSPGKDVDFITSQQAKIPILNTKQRIYRVGDNPDRKDLIIKKTVDKYNYEQLVTADTKHAANKEIVTFVSDIKKNHLTNLKHDQKVDQPVDTIYNIHSWPYFIIKFQEISHLDISEYPLEVSKYDSAEMYLNWISKKSDFQHLIYLIEKILNDLDVKNVDQAKSKLNSIKSEFDQKQIISKGYCEKEKCPNVYDTVSLVLDNLSYLLDQYTKVKSNVTFDKKHKNIIADAKAKKEHQTLINDILEWGIKNVYGVEVYNKVLSGQKLSTSEYTNVNNFLNNITEKRRAFLNNNCPHIPLRKKYDRTKNVDSKNIILDQLFTEFTDSDDTQEPGSSQIKCKLCGYNLGCKHEKLLLKMAKQKSKNSPTEQELIDKYYANSYIDYIQNIVSCKECGRKIKDIDIEIQIEFEKDVVNNSQNVKSGHTVYSQTSKLAQNELAKILYYSNLRILYPDTPTALFEKIEPILADDLAEIEERLHDKQRAKEKRLLLYINAAIIGKLIFDSVKFDFNNRLMTDFQPVADLVAEMTKLISELKRHRGGDIKKYYSIHNQLVDIGISYFIRLLKINDKALVLKIGIDENKLDKILHVYIKKYYQKFSDKYKFGLSKEKDGKIKFVRKGKIYIIDDIRYKINTPSKLEYGTISEYEQEIKKETIDPSKSDNSHLIGLLNYMGNKKWVWSANNVSPTAIINDQKVNEFNEINTEKMEVRPGIFARIPSRLIQAIQQELFNNSQQKNKTRYKGMREEIIFDLSNVSKNATLKYIDYNYLLYCPNGRPHLWIMNSSNPNEREKVCYWCKMTNTDAKDRTNKMTDSEYKELQKNINDAKIVEYFRSRCTDHTPHDLYNGYCTHCAEDYTSIFNPSEARIKALRAAWESKPIVTLETDVETTKVTVAEQINISGYIQDATYTNINKNKLHTFVTDLIKNVSNVAVKNIKKENYHSTHVLEIIDKIFGKGMKNFKHSIDTLTEDLSNLGYFQRRYKDDIDILKMKYTSNKDELDYEIQKIKLRYKSEQLKELKGYIETFFQHISLILNNSRSYIVQEIVGTEYLQQFINGDREDFLKFQNILKVNEYSSLIDKIMAEYKVKLKTKSHILQNILINDILSKLITTPITALFVLGYLDKLLYGFAQIGDRTTEEREFIDLVSEEKVLAKRLKFYRKLHEEKVEAGLAFADFEEQEAYFDAEKDTFQLETDDSPEHDGQDVQMDDDIITDINYDDLDVDTNMFDGDNGGVYGEEYDDRELTYFGNNL
jgi:hypothetical protein